MELESTSTTFAPESELAKLLQTWIDSNKIEDLSSLVDFVKQIEPNVFVEQNSKEEQLIVTCCFEKFFQFFTSPEEVAKMTVDTEILYSEANLELCRLLNYDTLSQDNKNNFKYKFPYSTHSIRRFHHAPLSFEHKIRILSSVCKFVCSTNNHFYELGCRTLEKDRLHLDFVMYVAGLDHEKSAFFSQAVGYYFRGLRKDVDSVFYTEVVKCL